MIHRVIVAAGICSVLSLSGCLVNAPLVTGSGTLVTERHDAEDFDRLDIASAFDVTAQPGAEYAVPLARVLTEEFSHKFLGRSLPTITSLRTLRLCV